MSEAGIPLRPLEIADFSGGMTDNVFSGVLNKFAEGENIDIMDDNKPRTRAGSDVVDAINPRLPLGGPVRAILKYDQEMLYQSGRSLYHKPIGGDFEEILGPTDFANPVYTNANTESYATSTFWNHNLITVSNYPSKPMRVFKDGGVFKVNNLGLPPYRGTPNLVGTALDGGTNTYVYAAHYEAKYTANGVEFLERGPVTFFGESQQYRPIGGANDIVITPSAEIIPNSTDCYDKANIKLVFYRNTNAGRVWYRIGEINNAEPTFTDSFADGDIMLNEILYTDGGVLDHEPPPEARFCHQTNDILYLGAVVEDGVVRENKLRMSNRFMLWSFPSRFEEEFEDSIMGVSSVGTYPIVFCKNSVYRLDGTYDSKGLGQVKKKRISDKIGCVSARSIIRAEDGSGIFFAGNNGFYYCDGQSVRRVSDEINKTYLKVVDAGKMEDICGAADGINNKLYWGANTTFGSAYNDAIFVGNLRKATANHVPLCVWKNDLDVNGFSPVSLAVVNDTLYRGNKDGYMFKHSNELAYDRQVNVGTDPLTWSKCPIIHSLLSICYNFGSETIRKWVPFMTLNANNISDLHLDIYSSTDAVGTAYEKKLKGVVSESRYEWGSPRLAWMDSVTLNVYPTISEKRHFPKGSLRCSYRQIRFTLGKKLAVESAEENAANIVGTTVNPKNYPDYSFPTNLFGLEIAFSHDNYKEKYKIVSNDDQNIVVENPIGTLPSGEVGWRLYAYPTDESFSLISYSIFHGFTSPTQDVYRGES